MPSDEIINMVRDRMKMDRDSYKELIKDELLLIDEHLPNGLRKSHIKLVLETSINMHYPGGN